MKELEFLDIIQSQTKSEYLGDDCAYLKDIGLVVTQDNFVEDVHFKRDWATPYQIGYKAAAVNISDILASGAIPQYLSVGISLPRYINGEYLKELYKGIHAGSYGADIIGGDITGGDKLFISITAIGKAGNRKISSRSNAKIGYVVITEGIFGQSSLGLKELYEGKSDTESIKIHLEPTLNVEFSKNISTKIKSDYAMMDTSDGLADSLFRIAQLSGVKIVSKFVEGMFGAEDYNLVAVVPEEFLPEITDYQIIGKVEPFDGYYLQIEDKQYKNYDELGLYDHFGE